MPENFQITSVLIIGSLLLILLTCFIVYSVFQYQRAQSVYEMEIRAKEAEYSNELVTVKLETKEQTLSWVSEEIHDNIGQVLSLAKLDLYELKDDYSMERTDHVLELVDKSINGLREISHMLSPNNLEGMDLYSLLRKEVHEINKIGSFKGKLEGDSDGFSLNSGQELIVYRMIQECINNAIKHSKAKNLTLKLEKKKGLHSISCIDDGVGFELLKLEENSNGLQNLKRRARILDAELYIDSQLNKGTITTIIL